MEKDRDILVKIDDSRDYKLRYERCPIKKLVPVFGTNIEFYSSPSFYATRFQFGAVKLWYQIVWLALQKLVPMNNLSECKNFKHQLLLMTKWNWSSCNQWFTFLVTQLSTTSFNRRRYTTDLCPYLQSTLYKNYVSHIFHTQIYHQFQSDIPWSHT